MGFVCVIDIYGTILFEFASAASFGDVIGHTLEALRLLKLNFIPIP